MKPPGNANVQGVTLPDLFAEYQGELKKPRQGKRKGLTTQAA